MSRIVTLAVGVMAACLLIYPQVGISQYHFIRCPQNPVMSANPFGGWDAVHVLEPSVLFRDGHYHMWYTGWDGSGQHSIGYARSTDGIFWCRYRDNPVLPGNVFPWTLGGIRNSSVSWLDSQYVMLFQMYPGGSGPQRRVGLAVSRNETSWHTYPDPVLMTGESGLWDSDGIGYCSSIIYWRGRYWTWFAGWGPFGYRIGAATSNDLIHWVKYSDNPVLIQGNVGEWDANTVCHPEVYIRGNKLEMWYAGWPSSSLSNSGFGLAFSEDGVHWVKSLDNPVFEIGAPGQWDDRFVGAPTVVYEEHSVKLWYSAYGYSAPWSGQWNVGLAEANLALNSAQEEQIENTTSTTSGLEVFGPNPFTSTVEFEVLSPGGGDSRVSIFNVLGQKVRELAIDGFPGKPARIVWDGKDCIGQTVGNGMYFILMRSEGHTHVQKVLKIDH